MKGFHKRYTRAFFKYTLFLLCIITSTAYAAYTATYFPGFPSGTGATQEEACTNIVENLNNFDSDFQFVSYGIAQTSNEILPYSCSDDFLFANYPACILGSPDPTDCQDAASLSGSADVSYTIEIKPDSTNPKMIPPFGTGGNPTANFTAIVKDQDGKIISDIEVKIRTEVKAYSGGHGHDDSDRHIFHTGKLSGTVVDTTTVKGKTDSNGYKFTFTAPAVSGDHRIIALCESTTCSNVAEHQYVMVGVDNLTALPASENWELIGKVPERHIDNHYLNKISTSRIVRIAKMYRTYNTSEPVMQLNDASLVRGGLFDVNGNWNPSHYEHRKGSVIDIRANLLPTAIKEKNYMFFQFIVSITGATSFLERKFDKLTGLEVVSNRHFHVRLEGRKE